MTHIGLSPGWMSTTQLVTRFKIDAQMSDKQLGMGDVGCLRQFFDAICRRSVNPHRRARFFPCGQP